MATPTLSELLTVPTQQEVLDQEVFPELRKPERAVRVDDWLTGSVYRAFAFVVALLRMKSREAIAAIAAAGFEDYAFGFKEAPGGIDVTSWAKDVAKQRYGVDQIAASFTKRKIRLTNATGTPYGPLSAGGVILLFSATGNRYILDETVTIPANNFVDATFRSEFSIDSAKGLSYIDSPSATIVLVTANFPGVTATNPAPTYAPVAQVGAGLGSVTPSGTPTGGSHTVAIKVTQSGNVAGATARWQYQVDGGAWSADQSTYTNVNIGSGILVTLADNSGNPAFVVGTVYYFSNPGSDLTQTGRDAEIPQELGTRCRGLWPNLALVKDSAGNWIPVSPTLAAYEVLTKSVSDQVKIAFAVTDGTINNKVKIYVAGQGALLTSGVIAVIQTFFNNRTMLTDAPSILSPDTRAITLAAATVTVKQAQLATAQAAVQKAIGNYLAGVDPKQPLSVNGRIDHAYIVSLIRNAAGVTKVTDGTLTINGAAADLQLPVTPGAFEMATWSQQVATALTWATE